MELIAASFQKKKTRSESHCLMFLRYLVEFVLPDDKVIPRDDVSLDSGFSDEEMEVDEEGTVEIFMMNESLS